MLYIYIYIYLFFLLFYIYIYIYGCSTSVGDLVPPCAGSVGGGTRLPGTGFSGTRSPAQGYNRASNLQSVWNLHWSQSIDFSRSKLVSNRLRTLTATQTAADVHQSRTSEIQTTADICQSQCKPPQTSAEVAITMCKPLQTFTKVKNPTRTAKAIKKNFALE